MMKFVTNSVIKYLYSSTGSSGISWHAEDIRGAPNPCQCLATDKEGGFLVSVELIKWYGKRFIWDGGSCNNVKVKQKPTFWRDFLPWILWKHKCCVLDLIRNLLVFVEWKCSTEAKIIIIIITIITFTLKTRAFYNGTFPKIWKIKIITLTML